MNQQAQDLLMSAPRRGIAAAAARTAPSRRAEQRRRKAEAKYPIAFGAVGASFPVKQVRLG